MRSDDNAIGSPERILELARSYQPVAVLAAAADLEVFDALAVRPSSAHELAAKLSCDVRAMTVLLDALSALEFLCKQDRSYSLAPGVELALTRGGARSVLAMVQHQANCMRRWSRLAESVQSGSPAPCTPSVRGAQRDYESFVTAMDNVSAPVADEVIRVVQPLSFSRLLDVGGASGTWTAAFLRACPTGRAVLFDLPQVIPQAKQRLASYKLVDRVEFVGGDFYRDPLPERADLAWVSAIVHQNSREQNRVLLSSVYRALAPGGRIAIRDILMEENKVHPPAGALFAVNMLVATPEGGTFTFQELSEDLRYAGFTSASIARQDGTMNSVVIAAKPG